MNKKEAIIDVLNRFKAVSNMPTWKIVKKDNKCFFSFKGDISKLTMQDYGRLCEIGYIVNLFDITLEEIMSEIEGEDEE